MKKLTLEQLAKKLRLDARIRTAGLLRRLFENNHRVFASPTQNKSIAKPCPWVNIFSIEILTSKKSYLTSKFKLSGKIEQKKQATDT